MEECNLRLLIQKLFIDIRSAICCYDVQHVCAVYVELSRFWAWDSWAWDPGIIPTHPVAQQDADVSKHGVYLAAATARECFVFQAGERC